MSVPTRSLSGLLVAVALGGVASADGNDTITYRCKQNDTLSLIASEFYGDRSKAVFIMAANKILHAKPLRQGQALRVPVLRELITSPSDTFQTIAETLLGDARRGGFLADINEMSPDDNLAAGTRLVIPFTVTHTAQNVETLTSVASTYFGEKKQAENAQLLRRYNNLESTKTTLDKNESILVPSFLVRVHPAKVVPIPDPEAKTRAERRRTNAKLAATAIPEARLAWRNAEFAAAKRLLEAIDPAYIDLEPAIAQGVLLGSVQVALGDTEAAQTAFRRVLDRKPSHTLRKIDHSPKVLSLWTKADGHVE